MEKMMSIKINIVNAFIDAKSPENGGNPAGVVLNADNLSPTARQQIAAKIGLSETAFISHSDIAPFKLEFYTPTKQIAQCGHATIAAFSLLREFGHVSVGHTSVETIDGVRKMMIGKDTVFLSLKRPEFVKIDPHRALYQDILQSLNLTDDILDKTSPPAIVNTGNKFMVIPFKSSDDIKLLQPDMDKIAKISQTFGLIGFYVFSNDVEHTERVAGARMFAPAYGIDEESATGMGAGCLAAYLLRQRGLNQSRYLIEQGYLMPSPSPSVIDVRIRNIPDQPLHIMVGGQAKLSHTLELEI
jgi:PhzF family phenazine biosynthesis protein